MSVPAIPTQTERRLGFWSALVVLTLGVAYIATGVVWWISGGAFSFQPPEPYLTIMEALMLVLTPAILPLMAAIHAFAAPHRKGYVLTALGFSVMLTLLTCSIHFAQLTVLHEPQPGIVPALISRSQWPSVSIALDLLAWCPFLGLALLFAAPAFTGRGLESKIRVTMRVSGILCVVGTAGPLTGNMWLTLIGTVGYDFGFLLTCALLAVLFRRV